MGDFYRDDFEKLALDAESKELRQERMVLLDESTTKDSSIQNLKDEIKELKATIRHLYSLNTRQKETIEQRDETIKQRDRQIEFLVGEVGE